MPTNDDKSDSSPRTHALSLTIPMGILLALLAWSAIRNLSNPADGAFACIELALSLRIAWEFRRIRRLDSSQDHPHTTMREGAEADHRPTVEGGSTEKGTETGHPIVGGPASANTGQHSQLFNSFNDAVFLISTRGDEAEAFEDANDVACERLGYTRDEFRQLRPRDINAPEMRGKVEEALRNIFEDGRAVFETEHATKDGRRIPVEISSRLTDIDGTRRILSIARDITGRKKTEEALNAAILAAEAANRAKSEFLANMSHEIRTPLNAVIGFSELLSPLVVDGTQRGYLDSIKSSSRNLLRLINDILDMSKIEARMMRIEATAVDPGFMAKEIRSMFAPRLEQKKVAYRERIDPALPNAILIDEIRLRQILVNLVGNAAKFTPKGEVSLSMERQNLSSDGSVFDLEIRVQDTGVGIAPKDHERIFDAFQQSREHDARKFGGTGLGLAITRKLVEMMNGEIRVESTLGEGATFIVRFREVSSPESAFPSSIPAIGNFNAAKFAKSTILVADDIESNRNLMRCVLEELGLAILEAENGKVALRLADEHGPDLILMDLRMPILDGLQATRMLRENPRTAKIPVVALTASVDHGRDPDMNTAGFDGYLCKPLDIHELVGLLKIHLPLLPDTGEPSQASNARPLTFEARSLARKAMTEFDIRVDGGVRFDDLGKFAAHLKTEPSVASEPAFAAAVERLENASRTFDIRTIEQILAMFREDKPGTGAKP